MPIKSWLISELEGKEKLRRRYTFNKHSARAKGGLIINLNMHIYIYVYSICLFGSSRGMPHWFLFNESTTLTNITQYACWASIVLNFSVIFFFILLIVFKNVWSVEKNHFQQWFFLPVGLDSDSYPW